MKLKKVKVLTSIAGAYFSFSPGQIAEVEEKEAERWIAAGIAKEVVEVERAVVKQKEKAIGKAQRKKR